MASANNLKAPSNMKLCNDWLELIIWYRQWSGGTKKLSVSKHRCLRVWHIQTSVKFAPENLWCPKWRRTWGPNEIWNFQILTKNWRSDPAPNLLISWHQREEKKRLKKLSTLWLSSLNSLSLYCWTFELKHFISLLLPDTKKKKKELTKKRRKKRINKEMTGSCRKSNSTILIWYVCPFPNHCFKNDFRKLIFCFLLCFYFDVWINCYIIVIMT